MTPVNDNPVAANDTVSTTQDTPLNITAASLLANDTDIDGDTIGITSVTQPANGTLTAISGGWTFTPAAGFNGSTSFIYTVSDGNGGTATATVNITVNPATTSKTYNGTGGAIQDFTTTTFNLTVSDSHVLLSVSVQASITHQRISDLTVTLIGPDGTRAQLTVGSNGTINANLSAFAGKQLAGTWKLEIVDGKKRNTGTLNSWSITATWGAALNAVMAAPIGATASALSVADASAVKQAVINTWSADGSLTASQVAHLESVSVEIADLPGAQLGFATWDNITIDSNAAGLGWFVDATQSGGAVTAGRMDLLSAMGHELGHVLGESHSDAGMMDAFLVAGDRTFSVLDSGHSDKSATGNASNIGDIASALRRLESFNFESWLSAPSAQWSTLSLGGSDLLSGGILPDGFNHGSTRSIFDEDSDWTLL